MDSIDLPHPRHPWNGPGWAIQSAYGKNGTDGRDSPHQGVVCSRVFWGSYTELCRAPLTLDHSQTLESEGWGLPLCLQLILVDFFRMRRVLFERQRSQTPVC